MANQNLVSIKRKVIKMKKSFKPYYSIPSNCQETCGQEQPCGNIHCSSNPKYVPPKRKVSSRKTKRDDIDSFPMYKHFRYNSPWAKKAINDMSNTF